MTQSNPIPNTIPNAIQSPSPLALSDVTTDSSQMGYVSVSSVGEKDKKIHHEATDKLLSPIVAASISGFVSRLVMHPTDTIKTRIMNQKQFEVDRYRGFTDAMRRIVREEGVVALYRGLLPSLVFAAPAQAAYLSSYDYAKSAIGKRFSTDQHDGFIVHFLSGLTAEAFSCLFWVPHDIIKERMQVAKDLPTTSKTTTSNLNLFDQTLETNPRNPFHHPDSNATNYSSHQTMQNNQSSARTLWTRWNSDGHFIRTIRSIRSEGLLNIYKGYTITLFSYAPLSGFYFLGYEKFKAFARNLRQLSHTDDLPLYPDILLSSMLGISFASIVTQPFELVKTRYQIQSRLDSEHVYRNSLDGFRKIIKHEGILSLWKGTGSRLIYSAPNAALIMVLYEYFKQVRISDHKDEQ